MTLRERLFGNDSEEDETMSDTFSDDEDSDSHEEETQDDERVPEGVLRGIKDIAEGRTVSKDDIEAVLKF